MTTTTATGGNDDVPFAVDPSRCIRCGACALLAPGVFEMTEAGSRVRGGPSDAEERRAAKAAVLICPTLAIRVRNEAPAGEGGSEEVPATVGPSTTPALSATSATSATPATVPAPLFPHLARHSEAVRWRLDAVAWRRLDPARAAESARTLVKEMAFSEHATYSATQRFMQTFGDDVDFTQWLSIWFYEETRHPYLLMKWLRALGEPVDDSFVLRGRVSTPFMRSKMGTLVTNIISEVTASSAYSAMGRGSAEPTLAQIGIFIAGDEARHAASFLLFARRRVLTAADPDRERLDAIKVLHFWLNESSHVSHPINQMLKRLQDDGGSGQSSLQAVTFDMGAVHRRVTRLIGLLAGVTLQSPDQVMPALKAMTADLHARRRDGADTATTTGEP